MTEALFLFCFVISSSILMFNYLLLFFFPLKLLHLLAPPLSLGNNPAELKKRLTSQAIGHNKAIGDSQVMQW